MSLRKIFTRVKENMLENLCTEEVKKKIGRTAVKVGNNAEANYFVVTAQNSTLTVGESAEIWLDGSHGKTFVGDIRTLDASTAQGKTSLAGNDLDNRIFAGQGDATLWGGNGSNDFMQGGTGKNTFFYLQGQQLRHDSKYARRRRNYSFDRDT